MKITEDYLGLEIEPYVLNNKEPRLRVGHHYMKDGHLSEKQTVIDLNYQQAVVLFRSLEFVMQQVAMPQAAQAQESALELPGNGNRRYA